MLEESKIINLDINNIIPNRYQPRKTFNENSLKELATSIKKYGIINPILVRKIADSYEIIAGERRWRAAKIINLPTIPAIVKNIDDTKMAELALIENLQRENLNPIEEAESLQKIISLSKMTQSDLGNMLGKSQSAIANKLRLLSLPKPIQEALVNKKISERHARSLLTINDSQKQIDLLNKIIMEKLSVKSLEEIIENTEIPKENIELKIDNIMESLKNQEVLTIKKEEKESDNMNNESFFPNFNQQQQNNNATLNSLNMQSMRNVNQPPVREQDINSLNQQNINIQPAISNLNESSKLNNVIDNIQPQYDIPPVNPIPNFEGMASVSQSNINVPPQDSNQIPPIQVLPNMEQPLFTPNKDAPLFNQNINLSPINQAEDSNNNLFQETPLFEQTENTVTLEGNNAESHYEVPVMSISQQTKEDNLTKTRNFLENEHIPYKMYSNETNHCIIIEL